MKPYNTNDLSLTAYLMVRGCKLVAAKKLGQTFRFTVDLGEFTQEEVEVDFINSEASKFDAAVRDLKKIMFGGG